MRNEAELRSVAAEFQVAGDYLSCEPLGNGHINETWCLSVDQAGRRMRYVLQRLNTVVFPDPRIVMENVQRVTEHLAQKLDGRPEAHRHALTLIPAHGGRGWHQDRGGGYWRLYRFIDRACSRDVTESPAQAYQAARAYGRFQQLLSDLPPPRLHDPIPHFHNTPRRFVDLEKAIAADRLNRAREAEREIKFALRRKTITTVLLAAGLPERVTHNDTKLNNVLLDERTGDAVCVVDLDTVMPGLAVYDFGDMVRSAANAAAEDETDLSKVTMRLPVYESLLRGYWEETSGFLTPAERRYLALASRVITFELGLRFLADFLEGDRYFRVHRPGQNLDRCRVQFKLVESIEQQRESMERLAEGLEP